MDRFDRSQERDERPPAWEPEPLELPVGVPPPPTTITDDAPAESGSRVLVIDLA